MKDLPVDPRPWLVAADWQSRALLLAELNEHGIDVRTEPGVRSAMWALLHERLAPPLLLLDTTGDADANPNTVRRLLRILEEDGVDVSLLLLVSTYDRTRWQKSLDRPFGLLVRPLTVGQIVQVVKQQMHDRPKVDRSDAN